MKKYMSIYSYKNLPPFGYSMPITIDIKLSFKYLIIYKTVKYKQN